MSNVILVVNLLLCTLVGAFVFCVTFVCKWVAVGLVVRVFVFLRGLFINLFVCKGFRPGFPLKTRPILFFLIERQSSYHYIKKLQNAAWSCIGA